MRIIAEGRLATLMEVEQVIEWLEERRIKLGGRARKYESEWSRFLKVNFFYNFFSKLGHESTEKLKENIAKYFGKGAAPPSATNGRDPRSLPPETAPGYNPKVPPHQSNAFS